MRIGNCEECASKSGDLRFWQIPGGAVIRAIWYYSGYGGGVMTKAAITCESLLAELKTFKERYGGPGFCRWASSARLHGVKRRRTAM